MKRDDHVKLHVLVEGEEAMIVSPNNEFEPIEMHYAEAVFIPASIGQYVIKPKNRSDEDLSSFRDLYGYGKCLSIKPPFFEKNRVKCPIFFKFIRILNR